MSTGTSILLGSTNYNIKVIQLSTHKKRKNTVPYLIL